MATEISYNGIVVPSSTHALYNGVKLPIIPADVLADYPYAWIRKHTANDQYQLVLAASSWYYMSGNVYCSGGESVTEPWYNITISTAETATEWTFNKNTTGNFPVDDARPVLWSNHDIPNGSATATDIYFEGTEVVPVESEIIGSLEGGQTATLACAGKKAVGNIVVAFDGVGSITYNGSTTEVESGKTATLQCAGKKMTGDVYVTVDERVLLLSGKYHFVNTPDFSGIPKGTIVEVNAKHAGTFTYSDIIQIWFEASDSVTNQIIIKRVTGNTHFIYIGNANGWQGSNIIDFKDEPQEVPLLFYDWVMANATKVE